MVFICIFNFFLETNLELFEIKWELFLWSENSDEKDLSVWVENGGDRLDRLQIRWKIDGNYSFGRFCLLLTARGV